MSAQTFEILLVEDQVRHQKIYEAALTDALAAKVRFATTGPAALAALEADEPPDLVMLDLELGIGGAEVLARIKKDPRLRFIPVIILTGHSSLETQMELLDSGADDFIEKGGPPAVLIARVRAQMRHKLAVDRLERMALDRDLFAAGVLQDIGSSKWTVVSLCKAARDAIAGDPVARRPEVLEILTKLSDHANKLGAYAADVIQSVRDTHRDPVVASQDVGQLLDWVTEVLQTAPDEKAPVAPLTWKAPVPLKPVLADRIFLRLAMLNIVQAAQKRARPDTPLTLTVTQAEHDDPEDPRGRRFVRTRVSDDGRPLTPKELTQIFQPGVSLGLALVGKVMARMGGRATAEALPEDRGLAVSLDLPLTKRSKRRARKSLRQAFYPRRLVVYPASCYDECDVRVYCIPGTNG